MNIKKEEFLSAGFFVTKKIVRPPYCSKELLPDTLISLSTCLCTFIPDTWCIEWTGDSQERRLENANNLGLGINELEKLTKWITPEFQSSFCWPNVCYDLLSAKTIVDKFLNQKKDVVIVEIGLHRKYFESFCKAAEPQPQQEGFAPTGPVGVYETILKEKEISDKGEFLGFEPLEFYVALGCSWLCNGLETVISEDLKIRPNSNGFIENFNDACKCTDYISNDQRAEPGLWLPWLIIEHKL